ncbi:MAG: hypothetical protein M3539_08890, partial [Acidobacteriota bacterium]|nr:hypothetical protein [Acidobacteriota bacterium]
PGVMGWSYAYATPLIQENTQRVAFANNLYDHTLDRSYDYDAVGRMWASHSGAEARAHAYTSQWGTMDGPYAENYTFDQFGNMTARNGWGVTNAQYNHAPQFVNNKMTVNPVTGAVVQYDAAGNLTNDGSQSYVYDATGQQSYASGTGSGAPTFTNDPLVAGATEVKALHITELRTAINQVRAGVGLAAYSWQYSVTTNDWITANPILEMRTALDQALGAPSPAYSAGLAQGQPILAIHLQELRERVKVALSSAALSQYYDGDRLRAKKSEYGVATYYLRSSVLGGQVVAELGASGNWTRGFVYLGGQMLAIQGGSGGQVSWVHQDPVTKSQRITNGSGAVTSTIDLDPWGGETNRGSNSAFQPHKYTKYERDANGGDEAMMRRYQSNWTRFSQPDPYDGSYNLTDPQSLNRYVYVQNDPVNFVDPSGLYEACAHEAMTRFLANLSGQFTPIQADRLGSFAGDKSGAADSFLYKATSPHNIVRGAIGSGPSADIHFASEARLASEIANFPGYIASENFQSAAFVLHSIQDVHGAHQGYGLPYGHARDGSTPDRIIGDSKFIRAANETFQVLSGNSSVLLSGRDINNLIDAIISFCRSKGGNPPLQITRPLLPQGGAGGTEGRVIPGLHGGDPFDSFRWLDLYYDMMKRNAFNPEDYYA